MKQIHVSCGIIESGNLVLAAQRGPNSSLPLKWEFPGGKIDSGESPEACLHRELMEELAIAIYIKTSLIPSRFDYPNFRITLYPFVCSVKSGIVRLNDHISVKWVAPILLRSWDLADADVPVLESYLSIKRLSKYE